ncbi:beta-ketoacyl synthase N-terminal-like domain-containing protein [Mesonia sp. K7]|uniref:beta-ketoacyl synthase N-terminal-like domain-containing protein n=1 Tax=Mesonia sp. K7 TaxID=2218606 RepID=UPI0011B77F89|nr:beta-ketoacyl synthase N-terminal-like domain-containing protein [Mesonia sp. K7]
MNQKIYIKDDVIISALGFSTEENIQQISKGISAIKKHGIGSKAYYTSIIEEELINQQFQKIGDINAFTKLEKILLLATQQLFDKNPDIDKNTLEMVIASTKGNIYLLGENHDFSEERVLLSALSEILQIFFGLKHQPVVVSNACVSSGLAISVARQLLQKETTENVMVLGGDLVSEFVLSGFDSFQALAEGICRPYDKDRSGINIGEAVAGMLLSKQPIKGINTAILAEANVNDANHISGPSRTGEGLYLSVKKVIALAQKTTKDIDYISAHGTATLFNDQMESVAFNRLEMQDVPLNSLKAYFGHTLGAATLLETIVANYSLKNNMIFSSMGLQALDSNIQLNVVKATINKELKTILKTASGFGGSNFAMLLQKEMY